MNNFFMQLAIIFIIVGLSGIVITIFDKKASFNVRVFFGFSGVLYFVCGIMIILKLNNLI